MEVSLIYCTVPETEKNNGKNLKQKIGSLRKNGGSRETVEWIVRK